MTDSVSSMSCLCITKARDKTDTKSPLWDVRLHSFLDYKTLRVPRPSFI